MLKNTGNNYPRDTLEQAEKVYAGWREHSQKLNVPSVSMDEFSKKLDEARQKVEQAEKLREERSKLVKARNTLLMQLWSFTKRVRNAAKATFGDDSAEIEHFGGKASRKRRRANNPF
ncbi:hypothetical protein L0128_02455 [candidate division KSB1 bacterium]|nr:hypothetical protein [candidate division KSB1 bacterium]